MAAVPLAYMDRIVENSKYSFSQDGTPAYEYSDTPIAAPGNGDAVLIPASVRQISVTLKVTAGSGKVQTSTSTVEAVVAGTADWVDWDHGVAIATLTDVCSPVTAIRQVNASGTTQIQMRAQ